MQISDFYDKYRGNVLELTVGKEGKSVIIGGEGVLPFHAFEGSMARMPLIALEVWDAPPPADWAENLRSHFGDVVDSPVLWAKKCVESYGADMICLYLASAAEGGEIDAAAVAGRVKEVVDAVPVPMIVHGIGDKEIDTLLLKEIARTCAGEGLLLGPLVKDNFQEIAEAAIEYGHSIIAQSPLDINLAKELNIKLTKFVPRDKIVMDPLTSSLGYGLDYSFSMMERLKHVAVGFGDNMMQMPMLANPGRECWRTKEAKENARQGILWEAVTTKTMMLGGANLAIMASPDSMKLVKKMLAQYTTS